MKSFRQFQEDSSLDAQSAISGSGGQSGGSESTPGSGLHRVSNKPGFKKRPSTGIGAALRDRLKNKGDKKKPEGAGKPGTDGPGQRPDRTPSPYRQKTQRDQGGALAKRPEEKGSMVQRKTAAAKQPPQHKQLAARPASTAMAGSRQRPAIRPGAERKALPQGQERKALPQGQERKVLPQGQRRIAAQPQRKALPPARG